MQITTKHKKYTLRKPGNDSFHLQTGDFIEDSSRYSTPLRRGSLARLLGAGGTHDMRKEADAFPFRRSWNRFVWVLIILITIWLCGFFIP